MSINSGIEPLNRKTEVLINGKWVIVHFSALVTGHLFRMFEPDGQPVTDASGLTSWLALSNARFVNDAKTWRVESAGVLTEHINLVLTPVHTAYASSVPDIELRSNLLHLKGLYSKVNAECLELKLEILKLKKEIEDNGREF